MNESRDIPVSPQHHVRLAEEYVELLDHPPRHDFVVRTIERREANGAPLMSAEMVLAGADTRERHPLTEQYPLHFRKTYFAASLHISPETEFERSQLASHILGIPPPIGFEARIFRSCLIPGLPYKRLSPFGFTPEESNLPRARELNLATAAGLWKLLSEAADMITKLHSGGVLHGDVELHNLIVCSSPLAVVPVDFEAARLESELEPTVWKTACARDFQELWREAILLQCSLGRQPGRFAEEAIGAIPELFRASERFQREVDWLPDR